MEEKTTVVRKVVTESDGGCSSCVFAGGRCTGHQCTAGHTAKVRAAQAQKSQMYGHANVPRTAGT